MRVITSYPIIVKGKVIKKRNEFSYAFGDKIGAAIAKKYGEGGEDDSDTITAKKATSEEKKSNNGFPPPTDTKGGSNPPVTEIKREGFFSKTKRAERKVDRQDNRDTRRADRKQARKDRKAKYGARPLNPFTKGGKQFWKDNLPKLKKKADGNFEKKLPDGTTLDVPKDQVTVIPPPANNKNAQPAVVETKDLQTKGEVLTQVVNGAVEVSKVVAEQDTEKAVDNNGAEQVYKKADVVDADSSEAKKPMSTTTKVLIGVGAAAVLGTIIYLAVRKE